MPICSPQIFLAQSALGLLCCLLFIYAGRLLLASLKGPGMESLQPAPGEFRALYAGILGLLTLFAIVMSRGRTVFVLVPVGLLAAGYRPARPSGFTFSLSPRKVLELLLLVIAFVSLYNFLPESPFKQEDSFFYLKVSEVLGLKGQENTFQYYNLLDSQYHGLEPYHYGELWLNALLLQLTGWLLPHIQVLRILTYTLISVAFVQGLFYLFEKIQKRPPGTLEKLLCFSCVFFLADIIPALPAGIRHYLVFNFEHNFLERPNFRMVFLFLVPLAGRLWQGPLEGKGFFLLLAFCLVSPAILFCCLPLAIIGWLAGRENKTPGLLWAAPRYFYYFLGFTLLYFLLYRFFGTAFSQVMSEKPLPSALFYWQHSWHYIILTLFSSLIYCAILLGIVGLIFNKWALPEWKKELLQKRSLLFFLCSFLLTAVVIARGLDFMENAYQIAYNGFIAVSLFVFMIWILLAGRGRVMLICLIGVNLLGYKIYKLQEGAEQRANIFSQKSALFYGGRPYSEVYLTVVVDYFHQKKPGYGGYIADSNFYRNLYYSRRSPNVYHLPLTYIIANNTPTNLDFCLSSPQDILWGEDPQVKTLPFLRRAIATAHFQGLYPHPDPPFDYERFRFEYLRALQLDYLILSPGTPVDRYLQPLIKKQFRDASTGELFLILN